MNRNLVGVVSNFSRGAKCIAISVMANFQFKTDTVDERTEAHSH